MTTTLRNLADDVCGGRFALVTEGGYDLRALADSLDAVCGVLEGTTSVTEHDTTRCARHGRGDRAIAAVRVAQSRQVGWSIIDSWPIIARRNWIENGKQRWAASRAFEPTEDPSKPKFYCLEMFAYPSGHAHVGHVRNYIIGDVMARTKRMRGFNVLHPFGWDAFGLPAENAAIKSGIHPEVSTLDNIAHMKGQLQRLGISYAWDRELATCLPDYYHWNQWLSSGCTSAASPIAGARRSTGARSTRRCSPTSRSSTAPAGDAARPSSRSDLEQWFLKITAYADELLDALDTLQKWPEKVLTMQRNWIGRSEGARVKFTLVDLPGEDAPGQPAVPSLQEIEVFTTRIDTIYGATFVLLAPEHPLVEQFAQTSQDPAALREAAARFRTQDRMARLVGEVAKEGVFTGRYAVNPFTRATVPIWVANFVLGEYGTGAVMAVPAHDQRDFEFAREYDLPVRVVVRPGDGEIPTATP